MWTYEKCKQYFIANFIIVRFLCKKIKFYYGNMDTSHDKKIFWGFVIFVVGFFWYAQETDLVSLQPFWPIMVMLVGFLLVVKGAFYKQWEMRTKRKR